MTPAEKNSAVAIFDNHTEAEDAVRALERAGFDMSKLSIVGRDYHTDEHVVGYFTTGDRMRYWGGLGAFWGSIWGLLTGAALFWLPGIGPVIVAGPVVAWILAVLEGTAVGAGLGALGGAFASIGIPRYSILKYETELRAGKFLLIAHGTPYDIEVARLTLQQSQATHTSTHLEPVAPAAAATPA
jgi:uncharacterized membrane protein